MNVFDGPFFFTLMGRDEERLWEREESGWKRRIRGKRGGTLNFYCEIHCKLVFCIQCFARSHITTIEVKYAEIKI